MIFKTAIIALGIFVIPAFAFGTTHPHETQKKPSPTGTYFIAASAGGEDVVFADASRVRSVSGSKRIWLTVVHNGAAISHDGRYTKTLLQIDCKNQTIGTVISVNYSSNGEVLGTYQPQNVVQKYYYTRFFR